MKQYILSITFSVIICLGASLLAPSEKYRGIIKIVCGVFVVSAILSPLKALLFGDFSLDMNYAFDDGGQFETAVETSGENFAENISENSLDILCLSISQDITSFTGRKVNARISENTLYLQGVLSEEESKVKKYVLERYGVETVFEQTNGT